MFVQYLNERQQGALLHYAHEMMRVDGSVEGDELVHLEALRDQAQPGVEAEGVPIEELPNLFEDRLSRVAFLLEVIGMGYADQAFDPEESHLVDQLANALAIEDYGILEDIKSWVKRQLLLVKEAHQLMRG